MFAVVFVFGLTERERVERRELSTRVSFMNSEKSSIKRCHDF